MNKEHLNVIPSGRPNSNKWYKKISMCLLVRVNKLKKYLKNDRLRFYLNCGLSLGQCIRYHPC